MPTTTADISALYAGSKPVDKLYAGSTQIWTGLEDGGGLPLPGPEVIGAGASVNNITGNFSMNPAYPTDYTAVADDYCLICLNGILSNVPPNIALPSGYAKATVNPIYDGSTGAFAWFFYKKLTASEAAPTFSAGTDCLGGLGAFLTIVRGIDGTTPLDATPTGTGSADAAAATKIAPSITPATEGALILCLAGTSGNNMPSLSVSQDFTVVKSGSTTIGNDFGHALASKLVATTDAVTGPTFSTSGACDWGIQTIALRPA